MATSVGSYDVTVRVKDNSEQFLKETEQNVKSALKAMADATLQRAQALAPMSDIEGHAGTLRASGLVATENNGYETIVKFGNGIAYARYQEFGGDDSREVQNYTTPGTQAHYLKDAGDSVAKEGIRNYL